MTPFHYSAHFDNATKLIITTSFARRSLAGTQQTEPAQRKADEDGEGEIQEHHGALPSVQDRLA